jgi:hypothetical protein
VTTPVITLWDIDDWDSELTWDHTTSDIKAMIKKPHARVFRRAWIKRRQLSNGLFESSWQEITRDVKRWGSINTDIDVERVGKLTFSGLQLVVSNIDGSYNPDDNEASLWSGYANQQRSLVKIECGFYDQWQGSDGVWNNDVVPDDPTVFVGIISGNIDVSDENEVVLSIQPLSQVFRDFPAYLLNSTGYTTTGITASRFIQNLRDATSGGDYIFRPFFNDTLSYWEITSTSHVYTDLNSASAAGLGQLTVWDAVERLAQAENFVAYISPTGKFRWVPKTVGASSTFSFVGQGYTPNTEYGHTIKRILRYGKKLTNFYSRVAVKFDAANTNTSFVNTALAFAISGSNTAWNLGYRTFSIENDWIPNSAAAASIASAVFAEVSSLKEEINFSTSLVPHLNLLDRVSVTYDATDFTTINEYWDLGDWDTLTWDSSRGDAIVLQNQAFKVLSININLDNLECRFVCRQL